MAETYRPPQSVARAAMRVRDARAELPQSRQGMTRTGLARMNQLANREPVSEETLKRMVRFFVRHLENVKGVPLSEWTKGRQAWEGWGGDAGARWAIHMKRRLSPDWYAGWKTTEGGRALLTHLRGR